MDKNSRYEIDMCNGPVLTKMLLFALPLMFSSILQLLFNAADVVVVGRCAGDNSLAAVGSTTALINLFTNLFVGLSVGANVAAARFHGARQERELQNTVHTAMSLSIISGLILTAMGLFGARKMLVLMQSPPEVLDLAAAYLRIYFMGMTASMAYNFGAALLRAMGDTRRPLYYLLAAGVINVILNLVFVIALRMDVEGVALATVISQVISAVLVVRCLIKEQSGFHLDLKRLTVHPKTLGVILSIGLPAGFQGIVFSASNVVIQSSVNGFGNITVAGSAAAANIEGFVYMAMNSFHQAATSFVSQNYGAGKYKRINRVVLTAQGCVTVTGLVLGNLAVMFGEKLLGIYTDSPEVIAMGLIRLGIITRMYALCGMMDVMVGALRGIGRSIMPMIVSLLGACGLRLLWLRTVFMIPEYHTITVVYLSYPISWIITLSVHIICFVFAKRSIRKKFGEGVE